MPISSFEGGHEGNWRTKYGRFPEAGRPHFNFRDVSRETNTHSTGFTTSEAKWQPLPLSLDFGVAQERGRSLHTHEFRPLAMFNGTSGRWVLRSAGRKEHKRTVPASTKPNKRSSIMTAADMTVPITKPPGRSLTLLTGLRHRDGRPVHGTGFHTFGGRDFIKPLPLSLDFGMPKHDGGHAREFNPLKADLFTHSTSLKTDHGRLSSISPPLPVSLDY